MPIFIPQSHSEKYFGKTLKIQKKTIGIIAVELVSNFLAARRNQLPSSPNRHHSSMESFSCCHMLIP
jgi:hypothetical protein